MYNFLKANAFVVVVETDKLSTFGAANFHDIAELRKVIPAHTYMFVIEKTTGLVDNYNLETQCTGSVVPTVAKAAHLVARPGMPSTRTLTYRENLTRLQWIPTCPKE